MKTIVISIVTHQSAPFIAPCLHSVFSQTFQDFQIVVTDNASSDSSIATAGCFEVTLVRNRSNVGFAAAHNQAIRDFPSEYVLVLNPDVQLASGFLEQLLLALQREKTAGTACGKLLRLKQGKRTEIIDSAGMILTSTQRHLDRGAGEADLGQYDVPGFVFGASGAAALYRRAFIDDARQGADFFDSKFFAFREDADLSWRGQWLGWKCLYWPAAVGWHERRVTPERRRQLPAEINYHSVKNRFLMRIKNLDAKNYLRYFFPITFRDLAIAGYLLLREWSSLPALFFVARHLRGYLDARRDLQRRRRADSGQVGQWFKKEFERLP